MCYSLLFLFYCQKLAVYCRQCCSKIIMLLLNGQLSVTSNLGYSCYGGLFSVNFRLEDCLHILQLAVEHQQLTNLSSSKVLTVDDD